MDEKQTYEIVQADTVQLGTIQVAGPQQVIQQATTIAKELAQIVNDRQLFSNISGKKYVRVEGWTTMGAMLGVLPREIPGESRELEDGSWEASIELIRVSDGQVIGRGSAIVGMDEKDKRGKLTWASRPRYARKSMALTRATGKAYRLGFSWIMALAGYEPTPAEEMDGIVEGQYKTKTDTKKKSSKSTKSKAEKDNGNRPYSPEIVHNKILSHANENAVFTPNEAQQKLLRYGLELCFIGDKEADDKRHTVLHYLTGHESSKDVDGQAFKAIVEDWLQMKKSDDESGDYVINDMAALEAKGIYTEALKAEGQQVLDLDAAPK